ncbi:universal stress protein [Deinococcus aquaedulcis]|uniref:universal stress protein n=1 Tax=Deinococcus aquaedulcis TaxID=2840455 RepID=UPI001C8406BE|nr:universal stress protein [Deinococcus aquaedulcis]
MYRHILVPVDDHPASAHAAQQAHRLTRALGGRVTLLRVLSGDEALGAGAVQAQLRALAAGARRPPETATLTLAGQDAAPAIAAYAARCGADLIVLGVSGETHAPDEARAALALALAAHSGLPVQLAAAPQAGRPGGLPWQRVAQEAHRGQRVSGAKRF